MKPAQLTVNNFIYALLVFYLVAKDPFYQVQALLFQDVVFKMALVKISLLLLSILIIPFFLDRIRITGINCLLFLFVVYNFSAITFINNDFPLQDRMTIFYVSMFLPLFLLVVNLFGIEPGRLPGWTKRAIAAAFALFTLSDCLAGLWQPIRGADYYSPFYSVTLLGIIPSKVITINGETRSLGFFLDGVQHGLFLNFALFYFMGVIVLKRRYGFAALLPLLLINIYLTYTRSIYVFTALNLALFTLLIALRRRQTFFKGLLLRNFWLCSMLCGSLIYLYGLARGESDAARSLLIRFESARFILDSLTSSQHNLLFGFGFIQNSELFDQFVPDNLFLALASYGGIIALLLFLALFIKLNREMTGDLAFVHDGPLYPAAYLFFVNIFAFGMFTNYLDTVFMFFLMPIIYLQHRRGKTSILQHESV